MMQKIKSILEKIEKMTSSDSTFSLIEKDLALGYTRDLYEIISSTSAQHTSPILAEEPESFSPKPQENLRTPSTEENKSERTIEQLKKKEEIEKLEEKLFSGIKKTSNISSQNNSPLPLSTNFDEDTLAEKMPFELEPELQNSSPYFSAKSTTDFMLWNKDLRSFVGINDRYNFISELFQNNNEAYEEIVTEISLCNTKTEALKFLEKSGITTLYKWKEDGFSEKIFYNILSQFFSVR